MESQAMFWVLCHHFRAITNLFVREVSIICGLPNCYLSVRGTRITFQVSEVTSGILQTETGLVSFRHFATWGDLQQVVVAELIHAMIVPAVGKRQKRAVAKEGGKQTVMWDWVWLVPVKLCGVYANIVNSCVSVCVCNAVPCRAHINGNFQSQGRLINDKSTCYVLRKRK